jgi:hypothetical protein
MTYFADFEAESVRSLGSLPMLEVQDWVMGNHPHENHSEALIFNLLWSLYAILYVRQLQKVFQLNINVHYNILLMSCTMLAYLK